jgi:hypothetical protein
MNKRAHGEGNGPSNAGSIALMPDGSWMFSGLYLDGVKCSFLKRRGLSLRAIECKTFVVNFISSMTQVAIPDLGWVSCPAGYLKNL